MASIRLEMNLRADPWNVWDAVRDVGAIHTRLAPDFVTDVKMDGDARIVTFANGATARETLVSSDDQQRRLVYAIMDQRFKHYSASVQVLAEGKGSRVVWLIDLLPNDLAPLVTQMSGAGAAAMKVALEKV